MVNTVIPSKLITSTRKRRRKLAKTSSTAAHHVDVMHHPPKGSSLAVSAAAAGAIATFILRRQKKAYAREKAAKQQNPSIEYQPEDDEIIVEKKHPTTSTFNYERHWNTQHKIILPSITTTAAAQLSLLPVETISSSSSHTTVLSDANAVIDKFLASSLSSTIVKEEEENKSPYVNVLEPSWLVSSIYSRWENQIYSKSNTMMMHWISDIVFSVRGGTHLTLASTVPKSSSDIYQNIINTSTSTTTNNIKSVFKNLRSEMSLPFARVFGFLLIKVFRMVFDNLYVDFNSLCKNLKEKLRDSAVVFVPTHKSHLDYLILSFVCFAYGLPMPRIAAGINLNLPIVGAFLRRNGSFFIKRRNLNSEYKSLLKAYVHELLDDNCPIEVFVEGGRSRTGRVCEPKLGFLSMISDFSMKNPNKKVMIVPVSIDYDYVLETTEYAKHLTGVPKVAESLVGLISSIYNWIIKPKAKRGDAYIRFGTPIEDGFHNVINVSRRISHELQVSATIPSTAIVASVLLATCRTRFRTFYEINSACDKVVGELSEKFERKVAIKEDLVGHGLEILSEFIVCDDSVSYRVKGSGKNAQVVLSLGYYRNQLLHAVLPTAVACFVRGREGMERDVMDFMKYMVQYHDDDDDNSLIVIEDDFWKEFYTSLIAPFVASLGLVLQELCDEIHNDSNNGIRVEKVEVVRGAQLRGKKSSGYYAEAMCLESLSKAWEWCLSREILVKEENGFVIQSQVLDNVQQEWKHFMVE